MRFLLAWNSIVLLFSSTCALAFDYWQALPDAPIIPENNPQTPAKIELGKKLFFDPRLSYDNLLSCNDCHNLSLGGDDSGMVQQLKQRNVRRSAPTVWNVSHMSTYFWDARAESLESQVKEHLFDPDIMDMKNSDTLLVRIQNIEGYVKEFEAVFPKSKLTLDNIVNAIASFERSLVTPNSRADRYIKGDKNALNEKEIRGMNLFNSQGCLGCHFGRNLAGPAPGPALQMGDAFYELFPTVRGSLYETKYDLLADQGRFHVSLDPEHKLMWRVSSLRNVALTAPYFHNGSVNDLHEAVRVMNKVQFNLPITEDQVDDIVSFLKTLTGEIPVINLPLLPE